MENIQKAHLNARKGKAHYHEVRMVNANEDLYLSKIQDMLLNKTFQNSEYTTFIKLDSKKEREIFKLPYFPDRIIHHCIVQILEPIWMKTLIPDTYSSLKGRGIHKGVKRIKAALTDKENATYCLKMDVRKFYPSHTTLRKSIATRFKQTISQIKRSNPKTRGMVNSVMSYQGWLKYANCHNLKTGLIDPQIHKIVEDICAQNGTNNPLRGEIHG